MPTNPSRAARTLVALLAMVVLTTACGGDDSGGKKSDSTTTSAGSKSTGTTTKGEKATDAAIADDPCSLIKAADLSDVTGIDFDKTQPGQNSCTYTSSKGGAAIALNFADLQGAPPKAAIQAAEASCDEGTLKELHFTDADGGFGCLVGGVATVAATGNGVFAVLTGATVDSSVGKDQILQDLATILENAIAKG